jgi:hypothetical protein
MDMSVHFDTNKESKPKAIYFRHLYKIQINSTHLRFIFDLPSAFIFYNKSKFQQMIIVGLILPEEMANWYLE